jgi:hypothetical protein
MFLMDLFVGVIFYQYGRESSKESLSTMSTCTEDQIKWVMVQRLIQYAEPQYDLLEAPKVGWRKIYFKILTHRYFDRMTYGTIVVNSIEMALYHFNINDTFNFVLSMINIACTFIFIVEAIIRILARGRIQFKRTWNIVKNCLIVISKGWLI